MRTLLLFLLLLPLAAFSRQSVDQQLAEILTNAEHVPGIAAAAVKDGEIVAAGVAGIRKTGHSEKVTLDDRFHLGSCTKSMTASLAAMLVRDGKLRWESTPAEFFPDIRIHEGYRAATLRQLLSHTGGTPQDVPGRLWSRLWKAEGPEPEQRMILVRGILSQAPAYPPGQGFAYSNAGYSIAGAMIEKASGSAFDELIRSRLFDPLGMKSAGFGAPATPGAVDQPYGHHLHNGKLVAVNPVPSGDNPPAITPAGRVHATILDFAKYASFHLGGVKDAPLADKDLEILHRHVPPSEDHALGWVRARRPWAGGTALTHTGTNTMFFAVAWLAPERNFAAVAACNSGEGAEACDRAVAMLIRKFLEEKDR